MQPIIKWSGFKRGQADEIIKINAEYDCLLKIGRRRFYCIKNVEQV